MANNTTKIEADGSLKLKKGKAILDRRRSVVSKLCL